MEVKLTSRLTEISLQLQEAGECIQQVSVVLFIVTFQRPDSLFTKTLKLGLISQVIEESVRSEIVKSAG